MESSRSSIINTFEKLTDIRHKLEVTLIEQVQQNKDEKFFLSDAFNSGIDLMKIIVERRYSFEKDLFRQFKSKKESETSVADDTGTAGKEDADQPQFIQIITIAEEQIVSIPLSVQNYDSSSQEFTIEGNEIIEFGQGVKTGEHLEFEPESIQIDGHSSQEFQLKVKIDPGKFETGKRYISSFHIKSKYERQMNVLIDIISSDQLGDKTFPIIRMLHS